MIRRILGILLSLAMVLGEIPVTAVTASAAVVPQTMVTSLAELYDGDEAKAREELNALCEAGLMDSDGNLVELDIREDGESVELEEVAQRIAGGEDVGALSVNGHAATSEKLMQLQQVSSMLDVIRLMDKDVEITDEHVANLESLIEGIADGDIDISDVISGGEIDVSGLTSGDGKPGVQMSNNNPSRLLRADNQGEIPVDNTGTGTIEATGGKYTAPYISESTYEENHEFSLLYPENTTWYTDSVTVDGVVTLSCPDTASVGKALTVTATLDKAQPFPVSFEWSTASGVVATNPASGTVTWEANDTKLEKTFTVTPVNKSSNWIGSQCFVINAHGIKNATFKGGKTAFSSTVLISANDKRAVTDEYTSVKTTSDVFTSGYDDLVMVTKGEVQIQTFYSKVSGIPSTGRYSITFGWRGSWEHNGLYAVDPTLPFNKDTYSKLYYGQLGNQCTKIGQQTDYSTEVHDAYFDETSAIKNHVKYDESGGNGQVSIMLQYNNCTVYHAELGSVTLTVPSIVEMDEVEEVSVPAGTYHGGEVVPVTVTLKEPAVAPEGTTLTVNNDKCPMLNSPALESRKFTFGYTVPDVGAATINVTALSDTFKNAYGKKVNFEKAFPAKSFGAADDVIISANVKDNSLDWENVKCGIDDAGSGDQTVTVVIPFKTGADKNWVTNEAVEINPPVPMPVPGYDGAEAAAYLKSAYFSADGGVTRYPVYVIGDNADVLATRFNVTPNMTLYPRMDTLSLYLDTEVGTTAEYFGDKQENPLGFACYAAADSAAPAAFGRTVSYLVKATVLLDKDKTTYRENYDEAKVVKDEEGNPLGFYRYGALYIAPQGEDYSQQHDVELIANEALYKAFFNGARAENPNNLILNYQISGRDKFSFTNPRYFTWSTSDESIATVIKDEETGAGRIVLNGGGGDVTIILTVGNGSERTKYDLTFTFKVLEGKSPYFYIPDFSTERVALTETDTDVVFSTNLTVRNANVSSGAVTTFTAKLYQAEADGDGYRKNGDVIWTEGFDSTLDKTLTHITVPGDQLENEGVYAVEISANYVGGKENGVMTEPEVFSGTAYLIVKPGPLKVKLNPLESYSADYRNLPEIGYTLKSASENAIVEYTVQKSGEGVSDRRRVTDGVIPFATAIGVAKPAGLKDAYTITVYARANEEDPWSVDSMLLRVYNMDALELIIKDVANGEIGGTTGGIGTNADGTDVTMDNHGKLERYGIAGGSYQLTVSDMEALRTDMSLQKIISANYGSGVWGLLSDKMQWESSDPDKVSINYKQGGIYSDIRNYSYTSYGPATDFLLVGKDKTDGVTITATHAGTGSKASVTVSANTLADQLYVFQFNPKVETDVIYTNGAGVKRKLNSNDKGELAVYEPEGIASPVMAMSTKDGQTYVGTIFANNLQSGERDIASLQLYPCNNLRLRSISNATLTFRNPDGSAYEGSVTLRAGVYKNDKYCPEAKSFMPSAPGVKFGPQDDIVADVTDGKLTLGFDPTEFKNDPDNSKETGAYPTDKITYVIEYRVDGYQTSYAMLNVVTDAAGEQRPTDSVIQLRALKGGGDVPQIARQTIQQYSGGKPVSYTRDVTDYTENIGISRKFDKVELFTDYILPKSVVIVDEHEQTTVTGEFALYTVDGKKLTGQAERTGNADKITELSMLKDSTMYVFPFSSSPIGRIVYTMTNDNMTADGISDVGENPASSSRIKAMFVRDGITLVSTSLPFSISNLSHQPELTDPDSGVKTAAADIKAQLKNQMSIGAIFKQINVNDMLKKGFAFIGGLSSGGDVPFSLMILPTEDPGVFRIVAFVGYNQDKNKGKNKDGLDIDYNDESMYEEFNSLMEERKNNDKDDDDDDDDGGEGSYDVSFSGTIILEAGYDISAKKWKIDFRGGTIGLGFEAKYEWSQNFMCGPIPANISFEVGANAELEVSFASKSSARRMLVDATIGVYIEAFAGLGFDASIAKLKLGIYGRIGADVNFLLLSDFKNSNPTGTKLDINGEIGIRLEVKVLIINYKKTFASTGFNWTKKWGNYDSIKRQWDSMGNARLTGFTMSGRAYSMQLLPNGTALVAIESGGEIENRDYLELANRAWNSGRSNGSRLLKTTGTSEAAISNVQTNAYPYSNPVFTDDGGMFLYISDNDNAKELQSVVSYAVNNGTGYENMGPVVTADSVSADSILADSDVVASGTGNNIFAAWVKQNEAPVKEMKDPAVYDDLGIMMNATEVYAGAYDGSGWNVTPLTDNRIADMSPTVASSGNRAIVAWRSLSAAKMPEDGSDQDISLMFNAENNVNYRIYDGSKWTDTQIAYNGATGTVNAIDSAMLPDGTALLAYTVRTGEDVTTTETFYTVVGRDGKAITTGRLTNDDYTDTRVQVSAVDAVSGNFVVGWYSEYDSGEKTDVTGKIVDPETVEDKVVAHDIRLARIGADGSIDAGFPESIGGSAASTITPDFRFSAPAGNKDLNRLSIVWSQTKDSESAEDAGKYELNAVRFFETTGTDHVIGVTTQTDITETGKNVKVDHFDTYTGADGKIYALILGSDYSGVDGIEVFDQIDLTNLPIQVDNGDEEPVNDTLTILEQNPVTNIQLGCGTIPETAIDVTAKANLHELVPGLNLPVQFTVKNEGTSTVDSVTVALGNQSRTVNDLSLLPGQSTIITETYPVPEDKVKDVEYTVTPENGTAARGTLILNRPDVGISGMKLLSEADGKRDVQVTLSNASGIPLAGSGRTVKVGLYTKADHEEKSRVGEILEIKDDKLLADIDEGIYGATQTLDVKSLIGSAREIPDSGIRLYAHAWTEDGGKEAKELYSTNNDGTLAFKGLLTKNNGETLTIDTAMQENAGGGYTVKADIRNNSMQTVRPGIPVAVLLDCYGNVIARKDLQEECLELTEEGSKELSVSFNSVSDNAVSGNGTGSASTVPVEAGVRFVQEITFDLNGGTVSEDIAPRITDFAGHITLPDVIPTPPEVAAGEKPLHFFGWYTTKNTGGEKVTDEYKYTESTTLYARYLKHTHDPNFTVLSTVSGASIVETCDNSDGFCDFPMDPATHLHTAMLTITSPGAEATYNSKEHPVKITDENKIQGSAKVLYAKKGSGGIYGDGYENVPVYPGVYKASIKLSEGSKSATAEVEYVIKGATLREVSANQVGRLTYTGKAQKPTVKTTGTSVDSSDVTFTYSRTKDGAYGDLPSFTNVADAGIVYYKASADWHDDVYGSFTVVMDRANYELPAITEKTYNGEPYVPVIDPGSNITVEYKKNTEGNGRYTTVPPTDAGDYNIRVSVKGNPNYYDGQVLDNFTISPIEVSPEWGTAEFTYDGTAKCPEVQLKNILPSDEGKVAAKITGSATVAGSYTARITGLTGEKAANYTLPAVGITRVFTIAPQGYDPVTDPATLSMNGWTYGDDASDPVVLNDTSGGYVNFGYAASNGNDEYDKLDYKTAKPSGAGKYVVRAEISETDNYSAKTLYRAFEIEPREVSFKWTKDTFEYDGGEHAPVAVITNRVKASDDVSLAVDGKETAAGERYKASVIELTGADRSNYTLPEERPDKTFTIRPRKLMLSWAEGGYTYNGMPQAPAAVIENPVAGDDCAAFVQGEYIDAGDYSAKVSLVGTTSANYVLDAGDAVVNFTIEPRTAELSWGSTSFTYNGQKQCPNVEVKNKIANDECEVTVSGDAVAAGTYVATAVGLSDKNYELPGRNTKLYTIAAKPVNIRWDPDTISFSYDGESHVPTAVIEGLEEADRDDVKAVVTGAAADVGTHSASVISLEGSGAANYDLTGTSSVRFTIAKAAEGDEQVNPATLSMNGWTYGDDAAVPEVKGNRSSGSISFSYKTKNGNDAFTAIKPRRAGEYTVKAVISETEYYPKKELTADFTIAPRPVVISWSDTEFVYDGEVHKPAAKLANPVRPDDICTVEVTGGQTEAKDGHYTASANALEGRDASNYILPDEGKTCEFTIARRVAELSWDTDTFTYDGSEHCPAAKVINLVEGDTCTVTVSGASAAAGYHTAEAESIVGTGSENYTLPDERTISYSIAKKDISAAVSVNMADRTYGDEPAGPVISGIPDTVSDNISVHYRPYGAKEGAYSEEIPTAAGRYEVRVSLGENDNYEALQVTDSFTIAPKTVSLAWSDTAFDYDGGDKLPTVSLNGVLVEDAGSVVAVVTGASADAGVHVARVISLEGEAASNYVLPEEVTAVYEILKADIPVKGEGSAVLTMTGWTYGDDAYDPVIENNTGGGTVTYTYKPADAPDDAYVSAKPSDAGQYTVRAEIAETAGYNAQTISADFVIAPKVAQLSWSDVSYVYDGLGHIPYCEVVNLEGSDSCEVSVSLDPEGRTAGDTAADAGEYTAYAAALSNDNYALPATRSRKFTIAKEVPYLIVTMTGWTYGDEAHEPEVYGAPEGSEVTFLYYEDEECVNQIEKPVAAGTYYVAALSSETENHEAQRDVTAFTIEQRIVSLAWSQLSFVYDGKEHRPSAAVANLVEGDDCSVEVGMAAAAAGSHTARAVQLTGEDAANYAFDAVTDQAYLIEKRPADLVWGETSFIYDATDKCPEVTVANVAEGDECTVTVMGASGAVGSHIAMAVELSNDNYILPDQAYCEYVIIKSDLKDETAVHIEDWTYGEGAKVPGVTGNEEGAYVTYTYKRADEGDECYTSDIPYLAGRYTVKAAISGSAGYNGKEVTADFEIRKAVPSANVWSLNPVCNDELQELVGADTPVGGSLVYALSQSDTVSPDSAVYSSEIPVAAEAGTYYVWYIIRGDENHLDSEPVCVTVTMPQTIEGTSYVNVSLDGITGEDGKPIRLILRYNTSVSYNGLYHRSSKDAGKAKTKKLSGDLIVAINSPLMSFATVSYKYRNNKAAYSKKGKKPEFMIYFKSIKGVTTGAQKHIIKKVNRKLKALYRQKGGFEFKIDPLDIGRATSCVLNVNKKGETKGATFIVDGRVFKLKNKMITTARNTDGSTTVTAAANTNFTGSYVKK